MKRKFSFADSFVLTYKLDTESGYYTLSSAPIGFNSLPSELRFEETQDKGKINSNWILRGRIRNGKYLFFTGLKETSHHKILFGDHYRAENKSFLICIFSSDNSRLEIYYFRAYYPHNPTLRKNNLNEFLLLFTDGLPMFSDVP